MRIPRGRKAFALLTLGACLVLSGCHGGEHRAAASAAPSATTSPTPAATPLAQEPDLGWGTPLLTVDFNQRLTPDRWFVYQGPTKDPFPYSSRNVLVGAGQLQLTGQLDGPTSQHGKFRDQGAGIGSTTNQVYGRWEARIRAMPGDGYSAVMTIWPRSNNWPTDGEIDVVEIHDPARKIAANSIHNGAADYTRIHENHGDFSGWHVYGVDWEPDRITYYIDGRVTYTVTDPKLIPHTPMHATLQLDAACKPRWEGCRTKSTPPVVSMWVDWMKVFPPATH